MIKSSFEEEESSAVTVDQEMDATLVELTDTRALIYKQLSEIDSLYRKAGDLSQTVLLQCSYEHEEEPDSVPFFIEAFQQHLAEFDEGKDSSTLIHCFPAAQTGIRSATNPSPRQNKQSGSAGPILDSTHKQKSIIQMRPCPAQIQVDATDLFV